MRQDDRLTGNTPNERLDASGIPQLPAGQDSAADPAARRYLVFAIVSIALSMVAVDQTIVATALGTIQRDLNARVNWSTWIITVYALGQVLVMPVAGKFGDQYGRK